MGLRSITKYYSMAIAAMSLYSRGRTWYKTSTDEDSDGGEDITMEECLELADIIKMSIEDGLAQQGLPLEIAVMIIPQFEEE